MKRTNRFLYGRELAAFAGELSSVLLNLKESVGDPHTGVALAAAFFRSDEKLFEHCDDSNGELGQVFSFDACDLFVHYAALCEDKEWLADLVLELQKDDNYGVRDCLIDVAAKYLPESNIRSVIERLWNLSDVEEEMPRKRHWLYPVQSLARQLHDAPLFERATLAIREGDVGVAGCIDIAEVHFESGDAVTALSWLGRIPQEATYEGDKRDELLLVVHKKLGNRKEAAETAWRIFRRSRHEETLALLLETIGPHDREKLLDEETRMIMQSSKLSHTDAEFLVWYGRVDEAESYLLARATELDGDYYGGNQVSGNGMKPLEAN